jgi:hypothetical protein
VSVSAISWVFKNGPADTSERMVLLAIADYLPDGGEWSPSMAGIAEKAGMTERGARGIIRRLEEGGWLTVKVGGGRGGKSTYRLNTDRNPEQQTRNDKPGIANPEPQTRNVVTLNPERDDTKPGTMVPPNRQGTVKEPSVETREVALCLEQWASPASVASFIAYRKGHKSKGLTLTGAKRLAGNLKAILDANGDTDDALAMAEEKGWASVEPDWYFKAKGNGNGKSGRAQFDVAHREFTRRLAAGEVRRGPDPSDPFAR